MTSAISATLNAIIIFAAIGVCQGPSGEDVTVNAALGVLATAAGSHLCGFISGYFTRNID